MERKTVVLNNQGLGDALDYVSEILGKYKQSPKSIYEAMLLTEESMLKLMSTAEEGDNLQIRIFKNIGVVTITLVAPGQELPADQDIGEDFGLDTEEMGFETVAAMRNILLRSYSDKIKYKNKNGHNTIKITVGMVERQLAALTLIAFAFAIVLGYLVNVLPRPLFEGLDAYLFLPVEKMFISMLQLITAPAVFFSIVCCVSRFADYSELGKVSLKIFAWYFLSTLIAVLIGMGVFQIFLPGTQGMFSHMVNKEMAAAGASGNLSIMDTIISTVPSNIIEPFLNINSLQLVFMAVCCGIAVGMVGDYSASVKNFFHAGDTLFSKMISLMMNLVPIAVFCATFSVMIQVGPQVWLDVFEMVVVTLVGMILIMLFYCLTILIRGRLNPIVFLKKYLPEMKNTFVQGSGIASIPDTIRCCQMDFGISPKVYSFAIPFGATVNLDGNCIYLSIAGLFLARMCGIELFSTEVVSMVFAIIILSIGAPITPGSALLCLFVLLTQMGVSLDMTILVMGVNFFIEMFLAMTNTMGDVAISLTVAKSENLVDLKTYYK